jgi:nitroreductase
MTTDLDPKPVLHAIRTRRSVKRHTDRRLSREELETLLELVVMAPNHRMTEPWRFLVFGPEARRIYGYLKGESRARKVDDADVAETLRTKTVAEIERLPALIGFVQHLHPDPQIREEDFASVYMGMQNLLLGAVSLGLGTYVKTGALLEAPETRTALGLQEEERLVALVEVGEPAEVPDPKPRTPAAERTRWLP